MSYLNRGPFVAAVLVLLPMPALAFRAPGTPPEGSAITTYSDAVASLARGVRTQVTFQADRCSADHEGDPQPPVGAFGAFFINGFINIPGKAIAFSDSHLIATPDGNVRTELVVYHIDTRGNTSVDVHFLSPATYENVLPVKHYNCSLGDGVRLVSVSL